MYGRHNACRKAANQVRASEFVWISDHALADAFQRFCGPTSQCKRHGSNVPGPLEAKRRLAKRRMAGMTATAPSWDMGYDLGFLFGFRKNQTGKFQWQAPNPTPPVDVRPDSKPPFQPESTLVSDLSPAYEAHDEQPVIASIVPEPTEADRYIMFCDRLRSIDTLPELRTTWEELVKDGDNTAKFSQEAFHTLRRRRKFRFGAIMDFLQDRQLNVPDAGNLCKYIRVMASGPPKFSLKMCNWDQFFKLVSAHVSNGVLSPRQVAVIIGDVEALTWKSWKNAGVVKLQQALVKAYRAIWEVLLARECDDMSRTESDNLQKLSAAILLLPTEIKLERKARYLLRHKSQQETAFREVGAFKEKVIQELERRDVNITRHLTRNEHIFRQIWQNSLSRHSGRHKKIWISSITRSLARYKLMPGLSLQARNQFLVTWLGCLRNLPASDHNFILSGHDWDDLYSILAYHLLPNNILDHFRLLNPGFICQILLRHWYSIALSRTSRVRRNATIKAIENSFEFKERYWIMGSRKRRISMQPFVSLIYTWLSWRIPTKQPVNITIKLVHQLYGEKALRSLLDTLTYNQIDHTQRMSKFSATWLRKILYKQIARGNPHAALPLFKAIIGTHQEAAQAALQYVSHPAAPIRKRHLVHIVSATKRMTSARVPVTRIIEQHLDLAPACPSHGWVNVTRDKYYELLALQLALDDTRRTQCTFRYVLFLHETLRNHGIPIGRGVSKALVHAGIVRFLKEGFWLSTERTQHILGVVREVEGAEVADQIDTMAAQWRRAKLVREQREKEANYRNRYLSFT